MSPVALTPAWKVFPEHEQERVQEQETRYQLLMEDADVKVEAHIRQYVADRVRTWGPPDTSRNPIVAICVAMSTPGHYGRTPTLHGVGAEQVARLTDSLWPLLQHAQYLAFGLGSVAVLTLQPDPEQPPTFELVPPHHGWAITSEEDQRRVVKFHHLRVRGWKDVAGRDVLGYAWDVWDVSNPTAPSFRVVEALDSGAIGRDITELVGLRSLEGDSYPTGLRDVVTGRPFVPYVIRRCRDDGSLWSWRRGRGAFRGTLNAMLLNTYCMKSARDCTGESHIVSNVTPAISKQRVSTDGPIASFDINPGEVILATHEPQSNPWAFSFGAGDHLPQIAAFAKDYISSLAVDLGVTPTDAARAGANPMSGVAIHLTNSAKREEQARQEPLVRLADLATLRQVVSLASASGLLAAVDPRGLGISYEEIEASPDEERQEREELDWKLEHGFASPVDAYVDMHPGVTPDVAKVELARIAAEKAEIDKLAGKTDALQIGQMDAANRVVQQASARLIPRDSAIQQIRWFLGCDEAAAETFLGSAGTDKFTPAASAP